MTLRSGRGGEYLSHEFDSYLFTHKIQCQLTMALTPQQNGVNERRNRTIVEKARSMAHASQLPRFLWTNQSMWPIT